jgi:hypothetical protein
MFYVFEWGMAKGPGYGAGGRMISSESFESSGGAGVANVRWRGGIADSGVAAYAFTRLWQRAVCLLSFAGFFE